MSISSAYKLVKNSIVAFTLKYVPIYGEKIEPPLFPPILGTGFVVREDGLIATNAHVVRAFKHAPKPTDAPKDEWPVQALLLKLIDKGLVEIPLEILGVTMIRKFSVGPAYYGPKGGPDLAFVHVKARGLQPIQIDSETLIEEGMKIATAGFPMGAEALTAPGWVHQVTPTLQMGIISAVLPFSCSTPHAYSINVMVQGGASGSPVFLCETGAVIGVLYGGLRDFEVTLKQKDICKVPTNISYVVPSHYLAKFLKDISKIKDICASDDTKTIDDMLASAEFTNVLEKGYDWVIRRVDPQAEVSRVSALARMPSKDE